MHAYLNILSLNDVFLRRLEKKNERKGSEKRNGESLSMEEESYVFEDLKFENCSRIF